jgi:hypothetical protein
VDVNVPPPQVLAVPLATVMPAGKMSVKPTPVSPSAEFGLAMMKVSDVDPLSGMVDAPKDLLMVGAAATVMEALAVLPVPALVELTLPVVLVIAPPVVPVTLTETVQSPAAAIVPPVKLTDVSREAGENVPPQLVDASGELATTSPEGKTSVKATPVNWFDAFGLVMVNVSVVVPFSAMLGAPKAFEIDGGDSTVRLADAVVPVPPSVEVTAPVMLFFAPAVVAVTLTNTLHVALLAKVPAEKLRLISPALGANVPHGALAFGVVATCRPAGNASVKLTPVNDVPAFALVKVNSNVAVPFSGNVAIGATVAVPPPESASPVFVSTYVNVVCEGTVAIVYVPLYPATPTPAMVTLWPTRKPC